MDTNQTASGKTGLGKLLHEHPVIIIVGALGSIAGICACLIMVFTLVTGFGSLPDLFGQSLQTKIVGSWVDTDGITWSFYDDGTCQVDSNIPIQGTYELEENGTLRFTAQGLFFFGGSHIYQVEISGDNMTLSDENGVYYFTRLN